MTASTLSVVPEPHQGSGTAPCAEPPYAMRRPRLLDLCCGAGDASAGYHAAGFDVVGVDIDPQPDYPFPFLQADALSVDLDGFDIIAASPPCQRWSASTPADRRHLHPDLLGPIRARLVGAVATPGGPVAYVIENVPGAPLHHPVTVCGDSLRLGVRRHRLFESNAPLAGTPCWHDRPIPAVAVYGTYGQRTRAHRQTDPAPSAQDARDAMGIDWMAWPRLTQTIPPAYTYWLGVQLITWLRDVSPPAGGYVTTTAAHSSPAALLDDETRRRLTSRSPAGLYHCPCGKPLPPRPATGRWPRYCCHACRQTAYRHRTQAIP